MAFSLKRLVKKAVKLGGKIAKPLLATTPVGQVALRAQQTLKSLGGNLKASRLGKIEPLSVRASVEKVAAAAPKREFRSMPAVIRREADFGPERFRRRATSAKGSRMPQKRRTVPGTTWENRGAAVIFCGGSRSGPCWQLD